MEKPGCCEEPLLVTPVIEVVSSSRDSDKLGVGSTPFVGDVANTTVEIPAAATVDQAHRYLFRLCMFAVPSGRVAFVRGLRTYVSIRAEFDRVENDFPPLERSVDSPMWSFVDGNVSWHLRRMDPLFTSKNADPAGQLSGTSTQISGSDSALLYLPPLVPYTPPARGLPPGDEVTYLGTWRDMRFPWTNPDLDLHIPVPGPCTIGLFASVYQTDPATRAKLVAVANTDGWRDEDRFVMNMETVGATVRYGHIAGAMTLELTPPDRV